MTDSLPDDDRSESRAERVARYWKNAETAFDMGSAEFDDVGYQYRQIGRMWAELADELERKSIPVAREGDAQRKRH